MPSSEEIWKEYKKAVLSKLNAKTIYGELKQEKDLGNGWVRGLCPLHKETTPSFGYNKQTLRWHCFGGCGGGSAFDYLMNSSSLTFKQILLDLGDKVGIPRPRFTDKKKSQKKKKKLVDLNKLTEECVKTLHTNPKTLDYLLTKRGLSEETIKKYNLGFNKTRRSFSIPIKDKDGKIVNIRWHNPKAKEKNDRVKNTSGYGSPTRLYGVHEMSSEGQVIITEGEWDKLILQQNGFSSVTGTAGCGTYRPEWNEKFKGKNLIICYDCDEEGKKAVNNIVLKGIEPIKNELKSLKVIDLPLSGKKDDKDISDFFLKHGNNGKDFQKIIDETPFYEFKKELLASEEEIVELNSFTEIEQNQFVNKRIKTEITICGETEESFHAVEKFRIKYCKRKDDGLCQTCNKDISIPHNAKEYIGSCMSHDNQVVNMLRQFCCDFGQRPSIEILEKRTIREFFCHQKTNRVTHTRDKEGNIIQMVDGIQEELLEKRVYFLSDKSVKVGNYQAVGYVKTHPKTQHITFLIENLNPIEDDFQSFILTDKIKKLLTEYQKLSWKEIIEDLGENIIKIYERDEIIEAILLTYCSPLWIDFNFQTIRGWIITNIIGDSGSGKTMACQKFSEFVDIGDIFSGLTGSRTGLAYAMIEHKQKGWQIKIGRYPANNRKILIVDESQYLEENDLRVISKAMEEGFLQIDRVKSKGYESMTRMISICNPKKDVKMDTFSFGCESLKSIFPPTIVRRIDMSIFTNSGDIKDKSFINKKIKTRSAGKISSAMLKSVIYWIWNRLPDHIVFSDDAVNRCLRMASIMSQFYGYTADIPLVPPSDFRNKLARIATAFAAAQLSTLDFKYLLVEAEHIKQAVKYLNKIYSNDNCQLNDYSEICKLDTELIGYEEIEIAFIERWQRSQILGDKQAKYFPRTVWLLRNNRSIRLETLSEQVGCSKETVKRHIKFLKSHNFIETGQYGYYKKPKFNKFIRKFLRKNRDFFKEAFIYTEEDDDE